MNPVIYQMVGTWSLGRYVLGAYQWSYPVTILGARLECVPPTAQSATIALEVGGVVNTSVNFTVGAAGAQGNPAPDIVQDIGAGIVVPPFTTVRWLVTNAPTNVDDAPSGGAITMQVNPSTVGGAIVIPPSFQVNYVGAVGGAIPAFSYATATHGFTPGPIAAGRASIINAGPDQTETITIVDGQGNAQTALGIANGTISANQFYAIGGVATQETPRLEFLINGVRVATLSAAGTLRVVDIIESDTILAGTDPTTGFAFYSNRQLTAVINATGLICANLVELQ